MKAIYNLVTFLAAAVVLAWAGWQVYGHWDVIVTKAQAVAPKAAAKCDCKDCKCCAACKGADACTCKDCKCCAACKGHVKK